MERSSNPVMEAVKHGIFWLLLTTMALLTGCGSRKSQVAINKDLQTTKESSKENGQVKKDDGSQEAKSSQETNSSSDEHRQKVIEELYNENGSLKSRITRMEKSKSTTDKTVMTSFVRTTWHRVDSSYVRHIDVYRNHDVYNKSKNTESSNKQWAWVVGIVAVIGLAFWFKPWMK